MVKSKYMRQLIYVTFCHIKIDRFDDLMALHYSRVNALEI